MTGIFIELYSGHGKMAHAGMPYPKPTNIFTNLYDWQPRPLTAWGKGAKYGTKMNNLTLCKRQAYAVELCAEIAQATKKALEVKCAVHV